MGILSKAFFGTGSLIFGGLASYNLIPSNEDDKEDVVKTETSPYTDEPPTPRAIKMTRS